MHGSRSKAAQLAVAYPSTTTTARQLQFGDFCSDNHYSYSSQPQQRQPLQLQLLTSAVTITTTTTKMPKRVTVRWSGNKSGHDDGVVQEINTTPMTSRPWQSVGESKLTGFGHTWFGEVICLALPKVQKENG